MTGKLVFRVDDCQVDLRTSSGHPYYSMKKTGSRTADLEITIDLDELRARLIEEAMRTETCKLTRIGGAIVARPVKGSLVVSGEGTPR